MKNNFSKNIEWLLREKYSGKLINAVKKDIERLKRGEPLDYIIGFTEFLGCRIDLSKKPLIPRPETEFWTQKAIEEISPFSHGRGKKGIWILDIFAGSGCIGIAILKNVKDSEVVFTDNNKSFLEQIKINCKLNRIKPNRYKIIKSDIFNKFQSSQRFQNKFDYIFANPPYIIKSRKSKIQPSVLEYEPKEALFAGGGGLFYIRKFLADAKNFLNSEGEVFMEFDSIQKKKIERLLKKYKYENWEFHKDQYGRWRYVAINKEF